MNELNTAESECTRCSDQDNDIAEYYREATDFIVGRATEEGSIPVYFEQNQSCAASFYEFICKIVTLSDKFQVGDIDNDEFADINDETLYVSAKTGIESTEIIKLILWLKQCHMMSYGGVTWSDKCPACGNNELYERESKERALFESYFECAQCGKDFTFAEILDDNANDAQNALLPLQPYNKTDPMEGLNPDGLPVFTEKDAVYRFRVGRRIIELDGTDTLAYFSKAIQSLYELDDERASSFYMGSKYFETAREVRCPRNAPFDDIEPTTAENYQIHQIRLYKNQKFLYLHDYMREHRFPITFLGIRT